MSASVISVQEEERTGSTCASAIGRRMSVMDDVLMQFRKVDDLFLSYPVDLSSPAIHVTALHHVGSCVHPNVLRADSESNQHVCP